MLHRPRAVVLVVFGLLVFSGVSQAQTPMQRAITLFKEAKLHYNAGHYEMATDKLKAAISADPSIPGPYRNLGLTYQAMGKCDLAIPYYRKYLELQPDGKHSQRVKKEIAFCVGKTGIDPGQGSMGAAQIVIRCSEDGAQVTIDGVLRGSTPAAAFPVQPGKHSINLFKSGFFPWNSAVKVPKGQATAVEVALKRDPKYGAGTGTTTTAPVKPGKPGTLRVLGVPRGASVSVDGNMVALGNDDEISLNEGERRVTVAGRGIETWTETVKITAGKTTNLMPQLKITEGSKSLRRWAWIATGAAVALGIAGGIFGLVENATYEEIRDYDRSAGEREHLNDLLDTRRSQALAANVLYGLAGAALTAGAVLFIISPEVERAPETGQTRAMLRGGVSF